MTKYCSCDNPDEQKDFDHQTGEYHSGTHCKNCGGTINPA